MKKNLFLLILILGVSAIADASLAQHLFRRNPTFADVSVSGWGNYPPFGYTIQKKLHTMFRPALNSISKRKEVFINKEFAHPDVNVTTDAVRSGELDIFLGAYHETEAFDGIEIVYPAMIINPITIFMLPTRINEVKNVADLQKLKGVRLQNEIFSDFVEAKLREFNVETAKTSYELFEKLFTKQVDYIVSSQYFGLIEASKLGLRSQISVAKQALWQIPMFVGISKLSKNRAVLRNAFTKYLKNPKNIEKIKQNMINLVNQAETNAIGTVPPTFEVQQK